MAPHSPHRAALVAGGLALLLLAAPGRALAWECRGGEYTLAPAENEWGVPTNTRIWWQLWDHRPELGLVDDDGVAVPLRATLVHTPEQEAWVYPVMGALQVLTPERELDPHSTYHYVHGERQFGSFHTGAGPDDELPAIEALVTGPFRDDYGDMPGRYLRIYTATDGTLVVIDRDHTSDLDTEAIEGSVSHATASRDFVYGWSTCLRSWPDPPADMRASLRFGVFDLAGNFSGWSDPISTIPEPGGGGAGGAGGAASGDGSPDGSAGEGGATRDRTDATGAVAASSDCGGCGGAHLALLVPVLLVRRRSAGALAAYFRTAGRRRPRSSALGPSRS